MAYTAAQQILIDAAALKVSNAQTALTSATNAMVPYYNNMAIRYAAGSIASGCYSNRQDTLEQQLGFGTMNDSNCKITCWNCSDGVADFNAEYNTWKNKIATILTPAQTAYNQAKKDQQDLLNSIKQEVQNDPAYLSHLQDLAAEVALKAKLATKKYWFWGVVVVVVGIALFLFFRWRKGKVI